MYCSFAICLVRHVVDIFGAPLECTSSFSFTYDNRTLWPGWNGWCCCSRAGRLPGGSGLGRMDDWRWAGFAAWIVVAHRISAPITDRAYGRNTYSRFRCTGSACDESEHHLCRTRGSTQQGGGDIYDLLFPRERHRSYCFHKGVCPLRLDGSMYFRHVHWRRSIRLLGAHRAYF
ncbi:MAG: hypothetical protein JWQ42_3188 [Edaphobacter sp.]|nr:hypothetical protein [Edaphobacter sp.]